LYGGAVLEVLCWSVVSAAALLICEDQRARDLSHPDGCLFRGCLPHRQVVAVAVWCISILRWCSFGYAKVRAVLAMPVLLWCINWCTCHEGLEALCLTMPEGGGHSEWLLYESKGFLIFSVGNVDG
jgi:hypothetical protein